MAKCKDCVPMVTVNDKNEKVEICRHCGRQLANYGKQAGRNK